MIDVINRAGRATDKIVPDEVVNRAVLVVVDPGLAGYFLLVRPEIRHEVRVSDVHPGIEDGDQDILVAHRHVPRFGGIDIGVRAAARLAGVVQGPLVFEIRVVRHPEKPVPVVGLGVQDVPAGGELHHRLRDGSALRQLHQRQAGHDVVITAIDGRARHHSFGYGLAQGPAGPRTDQLGTTCGRTIRRNEANEQLTLLVGRGTVETDVVQ